LNINQKAAVLVGLSLFLMVVGCTKLSASGDGEVTVMAADTTSPKDQVTPSSQQSGVVVVSGLFVRTFGDPPPGKNGEARINYTLTTSTGKEWILVFDEDGYWPANGIRGFHRRQVVVNGLHMTDGRLLVESLEIP